MTEVSIYKINNLPKLKSKLIEKGFEKKNNTKKVEIDEENDKESYLMEFYYEHVTDLNEVSWQNFAENFMSQLIIGCFEYFQRGMLFKD